jgi:hypothetical protein
METITNPKSLFYNISTRAGRVAQMVRGLPSKCEALTSNPIATKINK